MSAIVRGQIIDIMDMLSIEICEYDFTKSYWENTTQYMMQEEGVIERYDGYIITIMPELIHTPSFHLYYKDEWEVLLSIETLEILEDKYNTFNSTYLPDDIKQKLISIVKVDKFHTWYSILHMWDMNNIGKEIGVEIGEGNCSTVGYRFTNAINYFDLSGMI